MKSHKLQYARQYKPQLVFFTPFVTAAYIAERLIFNDSFLPSNLYKDAIQKVVHTTFYLMKFYLSSLT